MTVHLYTGSGATATRGSLEDPQLSLGTGAPAVLVPIDEIYAYKGGQRYHVWSRRYVELTAVATAWDTVKLTWFPPGAGADSYALRRGSTQIYAGTALQFTDTWPAAALMPSTGYVYSIDSIRGGSIIASTQLAVTTPARADLGLASSAVYWDQVALGWVDSSAGSVDQYVLLRNGTQIHSGAIGIKGFADTGLFPSTGYTYVLQAKRAGVLISTDSLYQATPAHAWSNANIAVTQINYSALAIRWSDPDKRSIDQYHLHRNGYGLIDAGGDMAHDDGGLNPATRYDYTLYALRGGVQIGGAIGGGNSTPARPTSSGQINSPGSNGVDSYRGATAQNVTAPWTVPRNCYVSSIDMLASGYGTGKTGSMNPQVHGSYKGLKYVTGTATGSPAWTNHSMGNHYSTPGSAQLGFSHPADSGHPIQWNSYASGTTTHLCFRLYYWWYSALGELAVHEEIAIDSRGNEVSRWTWDKETGELLIQVGPDPRTWQEGTR